MSDAVGIVKVRALAPLRLPTDLAGMAHDPDRTPTTIDMTLEGDVLSPPSLWTRLRAIWRVLPPGAIPALIATVIVLACVAVFVVGVLLVAIPVMVALAILGLVIRASMGVPTRARPPARR